MSKHVEGPFEVVETRARNAGSFPTDVMQVRAGRRASRWGAYYEIEADIMGSEAFERVHAADGDIVANKPSERARAVAQLFAAAPDMYEALKAVVMHLQYETGMTDDELIQKVIAPALAKADGRGSG